MYLHGKEQEGKKGDEYREEGFDPKGQDSYEGDEEGCEGKQGDNGDEVRNFRPGPEMQEGFQGFDGDGVCNSRHDLYGPGMDQEDDGTGYEAYEGDEEGYGGTFQGYGADYWKDLMQGQEISDSDSDSDDRRNENVKEEEGEEQVQKIDSSGSSGTGAHLPSKTHQRFGRGGR